jgi:predicted TIM-barrel fold metal-dependent hydrolase
LTAFLLLTVVAACSGSSGSKQPTAGDSTLPATEEHARSTNTPAPVATVVPTAVAVESLPIVDMHFHPDAAWDVDSLLALMDELGVKLAVGGSGGTGSDALEFWRAHPDRFVPFAGQDAVRALYLAEGVAVTNFESARTVGQVTRLGEQLDARCWAGIGELFVNTTASHRTGAMRMPADSALMRRLWEMSATYRVPLHVHMDADPASVAEMRRLLASNPNATWIWAHSGWYAQPSQLRELLQAHQSLYLELSFRDELRSFFAVSEGGRLREEWRALFEEQPERFLLGTDLLPPPTAAKYRDLIVYWRGILQQLTPTTAAKLAHENAERLLSRSRAVDVSRCTAE